MSTFKFEVDGMHCRSCELTIEEKLKKLPNVTGVDVDAAKGVARLHASGEPPSIETINDAIRADGYRARPVGAPKADDPTIGARPSFFQLLGLFALVWLLAGLASRLGLLNVNISLASTAGLGAVFMLGLVAASSSCVAVSGGLLLSSAASFNLNHPSLTPLSRMRPVFMFVVGRVASYALFGGLIGWVGAVIAPSSNVTGAITVAAAIYMLIVGLEMLHIAPSWLKAILPRMPKSLARRMMDAQGHTHPVAPFLLGAATFFIPCGFTQALQVYALTTGSFATSALMLMTFALGTAPALLALGWASGSLKGKAGSFFFRLSGALVVVMGLWNIQNGMTAMGYPLSLPRPSSAVSASAIRDPNVSVVNGVQVIRMRLSVNPAYAPSDAYTVKAGLPVRMEIEGIGTGCRGILQVPRARASVALTKALNVLEFTPKGAGDYSFSCAMGMFPGVIHAI